MIAAAALIATSASCAQQWCSRWPKQESSPFLWDANDTHVLYMQPPTKWELNRTRPVFHPNILTALRQNHRPWYKKLGKGDFDYIENQNTQLRVAMFKNAWCSRDGWIVNAETCRGVRNGGCVTNANFLGANAATPHYNRVVTLAGMWMDATWHFPMEAMVALAALGQHVSPDTVFHVTNPTPWVLQWLTVVAAIPGERVVTGTVFARKLVVPEMGRCGAPAQPHVHWITKRIAAKLKNTQQKNALILVKRTHSRAIKNYNKIEGYLKNYGARNGLQFATHDDAHLPPLEGQLALFSRAHTIVAPHGAALLLSAAAQPGTRIIEFVDPQNVNICYARLSYILGHKHHAIPITQNVADEQALGSALAATLE